MRLFDRTTIDDEVWTELEELLIAADVGMNTAEKLIERLKQRVKEERISQGAMVRDMLKEEMVAILSLDSQVPGAASPPRVTLAVGVNGGGKTTSIAKLAHRSRKEGRRVILAAADTFRAAAIDQLQRWAERVGAEVRVVGATASKLH